ncbi:MAG TPA: nicotinate (nicotinamide) nucleotide adenylyltransferase [Thermoanaerobaculia bacterium]|nr:nicotinate (nicotinamide) nucleotide adenylyltransferase [Thermoanaerobaculia bacterium]
MTNETRLDRIAICGGTFDPFHNGHLLPLLDAFPRMRWSRIIVLPALRQPFKHDRPAASSYHRFAMAVLATEHDPRIEVSPLELERGEVSYSVDTLEELRRQNPGTALEWVIGDDNLAALLRWKTIDRILELANFVVLARHPSPDLVPPELRDRVLPPARREGAGAIVFAENEVIAVSASEIRRRIGAKESIETLVHPRVARYIRRLGLYA